MTRVPQADFTVSDGGSTVVYLRGHPQHDAVRVDVDSSNTGSTSIDFTFKVDSNDELDQVESDGFASMDATVESYTGVDGSSGDPSRGTTGLGRVVAVEVDETDGASNGGIEGTVYMHSASDSAYNADAFVDL